MQRCKEHNILRVAYWRSGSQVHVEGSKLPRILTKCNLEMEMEIDYRRSHTSIDKVAKYSKDWDLPYRKMTWQWEQRVLLDILNNYFSDSTKIRYLDFACGTGRILGFLEGRVNEAVGVDVSKKMLDVAKERVKNSSLFVADITQESIFPHNSFQLITAFRFFLNAQWDLKKEAIKALSNLLSDDGYLVFNIHMNSGSAKDVLRRSYRRLRKRSFDYNALRKSNIINLLEFASLKLVKVFHFGVIPVPGETAPLPYGLLQVAETQLSKFSFTEPLSQYSIYLCSKGQ
jgi:SAM-dependent methyltransferase